MWVLWIPIQVLMLAQQALYLWAVSPAPQIYVKVIDTEQVKRGVF